ncbi:hypothetical protein SAMN05192533_1205 [Mesobacillus persicus]|uniref:Uncharacterized protein n=1 Tax=Mesobacillus persicus TaxID=930146 RepID=A0A1H8J5Q5_9BACI|nr:hypothetical protein [Mesobacillus persicus]SEN76273.1 hypothetical protein SAMN05192533_1205 [Mesobacillus persicus]
MKNFTITDAITELKKLGIDHLKKDDLLKKLKAGELGSSAAATSNEEESAVSNSQNKENRNTKDYYIKEHDLYRFVFDCKQKDFLNNIREQKKSKKPFHKWINPYQLELELMESADTSEVTGNPYTKKEKPGTKRRNGPKEEDIQTTFGFLDVEFKYERDIPEGKFNYPTKIIF